MRHNGRHNAGRSPAGARGKWQRHLLVLGRRGELDGEDSAPWRHWRGRIITSLSDRPSDDRSAWTSAATALGVLEDHGYVVVDPPSGARALTRRKINRYRLTPRGRHVADQLIANGGKTSAMVSRERAARRRQHPLYPAYLKAHDQAVAARLTLEELMSRPFADLQREIKELETALSLGSGEVPDSATQDVVKRAAGRYLTQLRALLDQAMLGSFMEESVKPLTDLLLKKSDVDRDAD